LKNKILFWCGVDFTHFCLSYYMQKKHDTEYYGIIDITNKPKKFFQHQKLVPFKKTWYFHDHIQLKKKPDYEYLKYVEEKYNLDLWKIATNERMFYKFNDFHKFSKDEILSILEDECRLFENILNEIKPDYLITKEPVLQQLEIFYQMCKYSNVKILLLGYATVGKKCIISQESTKLDNLNDLNKYPIKGRSFEQLRELIKKDSLAKQIRKADKASEGSFVNKIQSAKEFIFSDNKNIKTHYTYFGRTKWNVIIFMLKSVIKKFYRKKFIDRNLLKKIESLEKIVYFPLGVDLERNLLINAPFFNNQLEVIRYIIKSLPIDYTLCVKENPSQVTREWRKISEYKEFMEIPNLVFLHPDIPSEEIINKSSLVITITGTSGFEAAFFQKPSIIFSDLGYSIIPSVFRIKNIEKISTTIKEALNTKVSVKDVDRYFLALEENWINYDWYEFNTIFNKKFYHSGNLVDVNISEKDLSKFLDENKDLMSELVDAHLKKIKELSIS
jgi:hypothetical protein